MPRAQLETTFQNQHLFSRDYSSLYASLFGAVAGWLDERAHNPVKPWLLEAANGRRPLDVSLLLAAGLHRDILLRTTQLASLAEYYPSVGGARQAGYPRDSGWFINQDYEQALQGSIMARREHLREFIQASHVQTNETGRGISWLLPISLAGWARIHLLDLGASAGLNLAANRRNFRFVEEQNGRPYYRLGHGDPVQFEVRTQGAADNFDGADSAMPFILSRLGCDINPFFLRTTLDEATLAAFVWADQRERLARLREGIAAFRETNKGSAPVELHAIDLPDGLPNLLDQHISDDNAPLICYNTFVRMYLPDKGSALRHLLIEWAQNKARPVVWIQWEPSSSLNELHGKAPEFGWLAWTIDLWYRGGAYHWHVAWVHPHGQQIHWLPDLKDWISKARSL